MANATCVAVSHEGPVTVLSMQFEPHNLLGPDLMAGMREGLKSATKNGSRAILLKSGLRHFSAGADTSLFAAALGDEAPISGMNLVCKRAVLESLEKCDVNY